MPLARLALLPVAALLIAACSSGGAAPSNSTSPSAAAPATRVEVTLTDALEIEPAAMTVPAGVPVTFVVTNSGGIDHEFYLGDEAAQGAHAEEMMSMGGMIHDEPEGIAVKPGETKELTYTFITPGLTLAGCHVTGHYDAGMLSQITVAG